MKNRLCRRAISVVGGIFLYVVGSLSVAIASDWTIDAKVIRIQPCCLYVAVGYETSQVAATNAVQFWVDQDVGGCVSNVNQVFFSPVWMGGNPGTDTNESVRQQSNTQAVLSTLQLSLVTGMKVRISGLNKFTSGAFQNMCQLLDIQSLNF